MTFFPNAPREMAQPSSILPPVASIEASEVALIEAVNLPTFECGISPISSIKDLDPSTGFANLSNAFGTFITYLEKLLTFKETPGLSLLIKPT